MHGMRGIGVLLIGLCWLPLWTWAGSSECTGPGCTAQVSVSVKIIIPPPALSTRQSSKFLISTTQESQLLEATLDDAQGGQITGADGVVYVPADEEAALSYTVAKP